MVRSGEILSHARPRRKMCFGDLRKIRRWKDLRQQRLHQSIVSQIFKHDFALLFHVHFK